MSKQESQKEFILSYFKTRPNQDIPTHEVVDWVAGQWLLMTGQPLRDPDRQIRSLAQRGLLVKVRNGLYRYDPELESERDLHDFTPQQKEEILERDGRKCAVCGLGEAEGRAVYVDHIRSKEFGGKATPENAQVLCAEHNNRKKHYGQTEFSKKLFISLHRRAKSLGDQRVMAFCKDIFAVYDKHDMNGHIKWDPE